MIFYRLCRRLFIILGKLFFHLKVEGLENLPKQGGFILACNHVSSLDPFMLMAALPLYIRWVVIHEYYDLAHLRWMLRWMRFIRIENNLPKEAFRALLRGEAIGIFPEGRRSWDGNLGQARRGMAALARRTAKPVVPAAILGTFQALPRGSKLVKPHPVTIRIGKPLFFARPKVKGQENERLDQENTRQIMLAIKSLLPY